MAIFTASSSLPPLMDRGGRLVWSADEMASLFSAHSDAKQCRGSFNSLILVTFFRYCVLLPSRLALYNICFLILDFQKVEMILTKFLLFYKQVARELTPKLTVICRHLDKGLVFRHARD